MTHLKKSLAMLLALIMMFSSMSVAATAWTVDDDPNDITFTVKFFRESPKGSGNWIETEKAAPGESVKLRVYIETGFYTTGGETALILDKDFFGLVDFKSNESKTLTVNTQYSGFEGDPYEAGEYELEASAGWKSAADFYQWNYTYAMDYILEEIEKDSKFFDTHEFLTSNIQYGARKVNCKLDGSQWLYEYDLVINDNKTTTTVNSEGEAKVPAYYCDTENDELPIDIMKGKEGTMLLDGKIYNQNMFLWDCEFYTNPDTISTTSSIIFDNGFVNESGEWYEDTYTTVDGIISKEAKLSEIANPTHPDGLVFSHWSTKKPGNGVTQDKVSTISYDYDALTLYAVWGEPSDVNYTLKEFYMNADGSYPEDVEGVQKSASPNSTVSAPESTDPLYTLDAEKSSKDVVINADNSSVVNAYYERNKYNLVYHYEDNAGPQTEEYLTRFGAELPNFEANPSGQPDKEGYNFLGWTTDAEGKVPETIPSVMPTEDLHLYPVYEPIIIEFIYDATEDGSFSDGERYKRYQYKYGEQTVDPEEPTAPGKEFDTWDEDIPAIATENKRFEAIFTDALYTVTFKADTDSDGEYETIVDEVEFAHGEKLYPEFAPESYPLDVWELEDGTAVEISNNENTTYTVTKDVTFYTVGSDKYPARFYWSEEDMINGEEPYETIYVKYGENITSPAVAPEKDGYTFVVWVPDADGPIMDSHDGMDFFATFEAKEITVTYDANGGECDVASDTVKYEESVKLPEASKDGHEFLGWATPDGKIVGKAGDEYAVPTENITLKAQWEVNKHNVYYDANGGSFTKVEGTPGTLTFENVAYGADVPVPEDDPEMADHEFVRWTPEKPDAMPDSELRFVAEWKKDETPTEKEYVIYVAYPNPANPEETIKKPVITGSALPGTTVEVIKAGEDQTADKAHTYDELIANVGVNGIEPDYDNRPASMSVTENGGEIVVSFKLIEYTAEFDGNEGYIIGDDDAKNEKVIVKGYYGQPIDIPGDDRLYREGYSFAGWDKDVPDTFTENLVIKATWEIESYNANFYVVDENGNKELVETVEFEFGAPVVAPDYTAPEGYEFSGWNVDGETMPAEDTDFEATLTPIGYKVTYTISGLPADKGVTAPAAQTGLHVGDEVDIAAAPEVPGYDFDGWYDEEDNEYYSDGTDTVNMSAADLNLSGTYTAKDFVISYNSNGAGEIDSDTYKCDQTVDSLPEVSKKGFEFLGWYEGDTKVEAGFKMPARDMALEAKWEEVGFKVEYFYAVGGALYDTLTFKEGEEIVHPEDPQVEGFTFKGWADENGNELPEVMGTEDIKAYAQLEVNKYKVTYIVDGEIYQEYTDVPYQSEVPVPEDPEDTAELLFAGWEPNVEAVMPAHDLTYTAKWVSATEPDKYTATFLRPDGGVHAKSVLEEGDIIPIPAAPEKFGYVFVGWEPEVPETMPAQDMVFEPKYEIDKTFVTIAIGGGVVIAGGVIAGSIIGANIAAITGASIVGGILVIVGVSELVKHTHTVTYLVDGEVYKTFKVVEGTRIPVPADPAKDGFTFEGWNPEVPEKMGKEDLVFEATWAENDVQGSTDTDVDVEIPATGSVSGGLTAFAVISGAAAAAYVITRRKKED